MRSVGDLRVAVVWKRVDADDERSPRVDLALEPKLASAISRREACLTAAIMPPSSSMRRK